LKHLYAHLLENGFVQEIQKFNPELLPIRRRDVLAKIQAGDPSWERLVPPPIVEIIKRERLFGYLPQTDKRGEAPVKSPA
jgi:hypothetical protein